MSKKKPALFESGLGGVDELEKQAGGAAAVDYNSPQLVIFHFSPRLPTLNLKVVLSSLIITTVRELALCLAGFAFFLLASDCVLSVIAVSFVLIFSLPSSSNVLSRSFASVPVAFLSIRSLS